METPLKRLNDALYRDRWTGYASAGDATLYLGLGHFCTTI